MRRLAQLLARLRRDRRGVSAVEFALIAPFLIALYFGLAELSQGLTAKRRVSHAASAVGDLVAQTDAAMTLADLDNAFAAGRALLTPFATDGLGLRVTSVTGDPQGVPKVDWSDVDGPGLSRLAPGSTISLPSGLVTLPGESVIVADAVYTYHPVVAVVSSTGFGFNDRFYLRPRILTKVGCTDCVSAP